MTLIDQIKADREKGTPGKWRIRKRDVKMDIRTGINQVVSNGDYPMAFCPSWSGDDGDGEAMEEAKSNSDRIARVPDMEAALIAAEELAEAAKEQIDYLDLCGDNGDLERNLRSALIAFRKAIG